MKRIFGKLCAVLGVSGLVALFGTVTFATETERYDNINTFGSNITEPAQGIKTIGTSSVDENQGSRILDVIQSAINRVLGMLSFVALVLCLWGGFQMLTAGGDDAKIKSGTKILKNAGIGLAVIGLSWLVVSFIFRIITKTAGTA